MTQNPADVPDGTSNTPDLPVWDEEKTLIIFDGVCVLCSGFAQFVLARDPERRVLFALAQSDFGEALYRHHNLKSADYETNLVLANGKLYVKTRAFARVMITLGWPWKAFALMNLVPAPIADWVYDRIARNRYRIFGRHDVCILPDPDMQSRMVASDARSVRAAGAD